MVNILRYIKNCGELRSGEIYMYLVGATSLVIINWQSTVITSK
jgi:hypothetical protein